MNHFIENEQTQETLAEMPTNKKQKKNSFVRKFISTIGAAAIGSALTLAAIPYFDDLPYFDEFNGLMAQIKGEEVTTTNAKQNESKEKVSPVMASKTITDSSSESIADVVEDASKAIVGIVNMQQRASGFYPGVPSQSAESGSGSGVVIKKTEDSTYIVTNNHVIEGAQTIEVSLFNGEKATAELVGADALTDLAVIKIDAKYEADVIEFGDSATLRPGEQVLAIGNPLGLELSRTVTQGIISAINRSIPVSTSAGAWDFSVIQTDAAINPGNSGGALINTQGQVIGINSLKIANSGVEGLGFAIPSNDVIPIVNEIIQKGKIDRPYIGVGLTDLEEIPVGYMQNLPNDVKEGALVSTIDPNSAAAKAGLQVQDVIVSINGQKVANSNDLRKYLYSQLKVGDKVSLKVYQNGELKTIELTLTSSNNS
jgi:serine protease Do